MRREFARAPLPDLADENLRGYVLLLAAHFQGFCRDLHTECVQALGLAFPTHLRFVFKLQSTTGRRLDGGNATYESLRTDYNRFGLNLATEFSANPANAARVTLLDHLNQWRNYAAHHLTVPPAHGGPFTLATVRTWTAVADELAAELDGIMYTYLQTLTGAPPW